MEQPLPLTNRTAPLTALLQPIDILMWVSRCLLILKHKETGGKKSPLAEMLIDIN